MHASTSNNVDNECTTVHYNNNVNECKAMSTIK